MQDEQCGRGVDVEELWEFFPVAHLIDIEECSGFAGRRHIAEPERLTGLDEGDP